MAPKQHVTIHGTSIAYLDSGRPRPPIVLIHGNSSSTAAWSPQLEGPLAERWRLVALDLPGCGDSGRLADYSLSTLSDRVVGLARELGCEDAIFVGHSLGGHVLLEAAPQLARARGFVIMGTPPLGKPPLMEQAFRPTPVLRSVFTAELSAEAVEAWARALVAPTSEVPHQIAADVRRTDPQFRSGLQVALAELGYQDEVEIVSALTQPIAVLHGAADSLVNDAYLATIAMPTLWRGAVQTIEGAGHFAQLERPEAFDALLEAFARDCS